MCNCCWKTESQPKDLSFIFVPEKNLLSMRRAERKSVKRTGKERRDPNFLGRNSSEQVSSGYFK